MNVFNKYGIKEVADVTIYSIIRIDKEEFYLPVLYFDTLKTSSLNPETESNVSYGGVGNQALTSWSYTKSYKMKLEDALFSETSLNMALNGRAMAKLTKWTSALAKINVANHYGQKHYSTEAYPSPELTRDEWEIIYQCAQESGYNSEFGDITMGIIELNNTVPTASRMNYVYEEGKSRKYIAENRWNLMKYYYQRQQPTAFLKDFSPYVDFDKTEYSRITMLAVANGSNSVNLSEEKFQSKALSKLKNGEQKKITRRVRLTYQPKGYEGQIKKLCYLNCIFQKYDDSIHCIEARLEKMESDNSPSNIYYPTNHIGNEFFLNHALYFCFPHYLAEALQNTYYNELKQINYSAMPQEIVDKIIDKITVQTQIGNFNNDLSTIKSIDRFETCVVPDGSELKIDVFDQKKNLQKFYENSEDNYVIFYDKKTMLPFIKVDNLLDGLDETFYEQKAVEIGFPKSIVSNYNRSSWAGSEEDINMTIVTDHAEINSPAFYHADDYSLESIFRQVLLKRYQWSIELKNFIRTLTKEDFRITKTVANPTRSSIIYYFKVSKRMYFKLRSGTCYYKRSKTIDDRTNFDSFLGTNIELNSDYFSGEFLITGETVIRNQKSGRDEHLQIVINRASFCNPTALNIQTGNPQVFSFDINVLKPKIDGKGMIEIRKYDVEDDRYNGGKKIVPQTRSHVFTTFLDDEADTRIGENKPIY